MKRYNVIYEVTTVGVCLKYKKKPTYPCCHIAVYVQFIEVCKFRIRKNKKTEYDFVIFFWLVKNILSECFKGGIGFGFTYLHFSRSGVSVPSKKSLRLFESVLTSQTPPNV